jgi:hypothetical protein
MFSEHQQNKDWQKLMAAADEAEHEPVCRNYPDAFFPEKGQNGLAYELKWAKQTCAACPIRLLCADYGIKWEDHGIWGGLTIEDRKKLKLKLAS